MTVKIEIEIDMPLLGAIRETIDSKNPTEAAKTEISFFHKKILSKVHEEVLSMDSELPDFKSLSYIN